MAVEAVRCVVAILVEKLKIRRSLVAGPIFGGDGLVRIVRPPRMRIVRMNSVSCIAVLRCRHLLCVLAKAGRRVTAAEPPMPRPLLNADLAAPVGRVSSSAVERESLAASGSEFSGRTCN